MMVASYGLVGLFLLRLIKRHGWEYIPVVCFAVCAWWYLGNHRSAGVGDGVLLTAIAGVQLVTGMDIIADRAT